MSRNLELSEQPAPGQTTAHVSDWSPRGLPQCVCGSRVDARAARVVGVDGVVPACPACWTSHERNHQYATVGSAVRHFLGGTGYRNRDVEIDAAMHPEVSEDA